MGTLPGFQVSLSGLSHTYPDDVDMFLQGPGGQKVMLMSDAGGDRPFGLNNVNLTFSDSASGTLPDASQITSGTYRPTNYKVGDVFLAPAPVGPYGTALSAFNGTNPNGQWKLFVQDDLEGDSGSIFGGWSLTIQATDAISGTAGADNLTGTAKADIINGLAGNDSLKGLGENDALDGGGGDDRLHGGLGNDQLTGGLGADNFIYNTNAAFATSAVGVDTITDFTIAQGDKIVLDKTTFTSISSMAGTGFSIANEFAQVTTEALAATSAADIVYNTATGGLFYNPNGAAAGFGTGSKFLTLTNKPALTASQFLIQA